MRDISKARVVGQKAKFVRRLIVGNANRVEAVFLHSDLSVRDVFLSDSHRPGMWGFDPQLPAAPFGVARQIGYIFEARSQGSPNEHLVNANDPGHLLLSF